jgi:hypothetical protein
MYRPLSPNEYAVVSKVIYQERGLDGGLAESMFMAYKARAMALDEPEFTIFQESEVERKGRLAEKQREKVLDLNAGAELGPMEFLQKLESFSEKEKPNQDPKNCYEWFYGDEAALDIRHKRLRVKFFNSPKYRKQVLRSYLEDGVIQESQLGDVRLIGELIGEFHRKYPGTRQGIISYYEILFGDPSGFSYRCAMEREAFYNVPEFRTDLLRRLNLNEGLSNEEVREALKKYAIEHGTVTLDQVRKWEIPLCDNT